MESTSPVESFQPSRMKRRAGLVILVLGIGLAIALVMNPRREPVDPIFGGPAGLAIVVNADRVQACRLGPNSEGGNDELPDWRKAPILDGPVDLSPEDVAELKVVLADSASYSWTAKKACLPSYEVRFSFLRGKDWVDVYVCLRCEITLVARDDEMVGGGDLQLGGKLLRDLAKRLFPDDEAIQALTERG